MDLRQRFALTLLLLLGLVSVTEAGLLDRLEQAARPTRLEGQREFLPPDLAFRVTERSVADGVLEIEFDIEPGYYLYRERFAVSAITPGVALGAMVLPASEPKDDPEFGVVEVYKYDMALRVPVLERPAATNLVEVEVRYQGCAEDGICYPPARKTVAYVPAAAGAARAGAPPPPPVGAAGVGPPDRRAAEVGERPRAMTR